MLICDYIVESIDGDYAHLRRTDLPEEELKLVARALLPFDITDIATFTGYNDASYFTQIFRKSCGMTPSEYRTLEREKEKQNSDI